MDEDIAEQVKTLARQTGRPFKTVVNELLRSGLSGGKQAGASRFKVKAKRMGVTPGLDLDNIHGLLDRIEGPEHR